MNIEDKIFRSPRLVSNLIFERFIDVFGTNISTVVNISGWEDSDKDGRRYFDYFKQIKLKKYDISNVGGYRGAVSQNQLCIDLDDRSFLAEPFYDLVFCHTVLEHVFDLFNAVRILSDLSSRFVFCVVPHVQQSHSTEDFGDYWRFNKEGIERLFLNQGITSWVSLYAERNGSSSYLCFIGSKCDQDQASFDKIFSSNDEPKFVKNGLLFYATRLWRKLRKY
ncbi:hypothetical protein N9W31_00695 [Litoricolaceae bacterium]|nr:hypothetical protein [Litorivicinaceae bacterium]